MSIDVQLGTERFDLGQTDRTTDQGLWHCIAPHNGYWVDVYLAGDDNGPDPSRLDLAARVVTRLGPLAAAARLYLRAFVNESKLNGPGEWNLEWLEFGRQPDKMPEPFELVLMHDGDSGVWGVRFFHGSSGWRPYEFRRFQW